MKVDINQIYCKKIMDQKYIYKMKHAIGLDHKDPKYGVYEAYRNCVYYNEPQEEWEWLHENGFAKKNASEDGKEVFYSCTKEGLQEVANATGLLIRYTIEVEPKKHK